MECPGHHMVEDENSSYAKDNAEKDIESVTMIVGESAREYLARAKGLASAAKYHEVEVADKEICRCILAGLHFFRESFALRIEYSLNELE